MASMGISGITKSDKKLHLNLATLKKGGERFEIDVDPDLALDFKMGKNADIHEVLKAEKIFSDAKKGMIASEHKLEELFGTSDPLEVAKIIIKEGEIQLTAEYREKKQEERRNKVINMIARNAIDPTTKLPHPPNRIEAAIKEAKVKIDEYRSPEEQIEDIVRKLQPIIPIKLEIEKIEVRIPSRYAPKVHSFVKSYCKITKEIWEDDRSWYGIVELPGGLVEEFFNKLNSLTKGDAETKIITK